MAAPTNTVTGLNNIGQREDLEDMIYLIAPQTTPLISAIDKGTAKAIKHDWETETLAAPNANNAALEGGDVGTLDAPNLPARVENICQIFTKTGGVARTQDVVVLAGRDKETARQKVMKMKEIRRDMEARATGNFASNVEAGTTARATGGLLAWIATNTSSGAGGSAGGYNGSVVAAATNGTQRAFTETLLKALMAQVFNSGGLPTVALMGGTLKQEASSFTGIAEIRQDNGTTPKMATIVAAADIYVSDFGTLSMVPHPYSFARDFAVIDPDMVAWGVLDGTKTKPLGDTGDSTKWLMTHEACLIVRNEKACGAVRDLQ